MFSNSEKIATILLGDKNALTTPTFNLRSVKRQLVKAADKCDLAVLGSSRAFPIGRKTISRNSCLNLALPMGSLVDYLAFTELLINSSGLPQEVMIAPDFWILDDSHKPYMQMEEHYKDYKRMLKRLNLDLGVPNASRSFYATVLAQRLKGAQMAFSFVYFQKILAKIYSTGLTLDSFGGNYIKAQQTEQDYNSKLNTMYPDGSYGRSTLEKNTSTEEAQQALMRRLRMGSGNTFPWFVKFSTISETKKEILKALLTHIPHIEIEGGFPFRLKLLYYKENHVFKR